MEKILLQEHKNGTESTLTTFLVNDSEIAVIVVPGGGYQMCSEREGKPIAEAFNKSNISAFVLEYGVNGCIMPEPLVDLALAVKHVRENAELYKINPDKIFLIGFSAGGHLVGMLSNMWKRKYLRNLVDATNDEFKPNGAIMCYPVVTCRGKNVHTVSFENLLGTKDKKIWIKYCLDRLVNDNTVPTFVWHTVEDTCVSVENTLLYTFALQLKKIPFESHIFPKGVHGLSLANEITSGNNEAMVQKEVQVWFELAVKWLKSQN